MNENDLRLLCTLCAGDFEKAYCRGGSTVLTKEDGSRLEAKKAPTLEKAAYMVALYRRTPSLFASFVRRHEKSNTPGVEEFMARCKVWCTSNGYMPGDDT